MTSPAAPAESVRLTVDLDPALHRRLSEWAAEMAKGHRRPRLALTDAMRAMITATLEDSDVAAAVETELLSSRWAPR